MRCDRIRLAMILAKLACDAFAVINYRNVYRRIFAEFLDARVSVLSRIQISSEHRTGHTPERTHFKMASTSGTAAADGVFSNCWKTEIA